MNTHFVRCLQNVECEFCEFEVTDGPITGNLFARNTLILKTKFTAVDGSITMISSTTAGIFNRLVAGIMTTTGSISFSSQSTQGPRRGSRLEEITTRSRNAPVRLEVVDAPVDSALKLFLKDMRGLLEVYLHPTYQGWFSSEAPRWVSVDIQRIRLDAEEEEPGLGWVEHPAWFQTRLVWSGLVGRSTHTSAPVQAKPSVLQ